MDRIVRRGGQILNVQSKPIGSNITSMWWGWRFVFMLSINRNSRLQCSGAPAAWPYWCRSLEKTLRKLGEHLLLDQTHHAHQLEYFQRGKADVIVQYMCDFTTTRWSYFPMNSLVQTPTMLSQSTACTFSSAGNPVFVGNNESRWRWHRCATIKADAPLCVNELL